MHRAPALARTPGRPGWAAHSTVPAGHEVGTAPAQAQTQKVGNCHLQTRASKVLSQVYLCSWRCVWLPHRGQPRGRQQHTRAEGVGRGHSTPALAFLTAQQNKPNAAGQVGEQSCRSWGTPACVARVLLQGCGQHLIPLREAGHRRKPWSTAPPEAREQLGMRHRDAMLAQTPGLRTVTTPGPGQPGSQTASPLCTASARCGGSRTSESCR